MIPYGKQEITDADVDAVAKALRDPFVTQGPGVDRFEAALAEAVGARFAVAVNSGTAALHTAYAAAGIGPGMSVVTSPITFVATANSSLYLGGEVTFADVDVQTGLIDPNTIAEAVDERTRLLAPVHYGGAAADMDAMRQLADANHWIIVEDAAHALGSRYRTTDGRTHTVGSCAHSEMCCFSFHPVKHVTTGEGGAITTNDETLARRLRRFRTHGITRDPSELERNEGPWYYEQHELGFNYRITDFQCALGTSQLERLPEIVCRRREHAAAYDAAFARVGHVTPVLVPERAESSYHLYVVRVPADRRRAIFDKLRAAGIGVNVHYIPVHQQPFYRARGVRRNASPNADAFYSQALTLPMYPGLTAEERQYVVASVAEA